MAHVCCVLYSTLLYSSILSLPSSVHSFIQIQSKFQSASSNSADPGFWFLEGNLVLLLLLPCSCAAAAAAAAGSGWQRRSCEQRAGCCRWSSPDGEPHVMMLTMIIVIIIIMATEVGARAGATSLFLSLLAEAKTKPSRAEPSRDPIRPI